MLDWLSLTTAPVETFAFDGTSCTRASGFFYGRNDEKFFFVTNWHVVTGRDPSRPNIVGHGYKTPMKMSVRLHKRTARDGAISISSKIDLSVDLNDATGDAPKWFEHSHHGQAADVVVLAIAREAIEEQIILKTIAECDLTAAYSEAVMDDIFVIGYPWGLHGGDSVLPLYKRGSIASEPTIDQQGLPRFLIDCRTSPSMSGSPVICAHSGIWSPNGELDDDALIGTVKKFVGVYSGRLYEQNSSVAQDGLQKITDIGQVWKAHVIEEIVTKGRHGKAFSELAR